MGRGRREDSADVIKMVGMGNTETGNRACIHGKPGIQRCSAHFFGCFHLLLSKPLSVRARARRKKKSIAGANLKLIKQGSRPKTGACGNEGHGWKESSCPASM